jgi:hypothetical protein
MAYEDDFATFKVLWGEVRDAHASPGAPADLGQKLDRALRFRAELRQRLADEHGFWIGDQMLFEHELEAGALARLIDPFTTEWLAGRRPGDIYAAVAPLLAEPGNPNSHTPS